MSLLRAAVSERSSSRRSSPAIGEFAWIWLATAALFAVSAVVAPGTMRIGSLAAMLPFAAILAVVAMGQTLVIQQRGLDMSVVALVALGGVVAAEVGAKTGFASLGVFVAVVCGVALGAVNGGLVAKLNVMPIVATLATNALYLGLVRVVSGDMVAVAPAPLSAFVGGSWLGVPNVVVLSALTIGVVSLISRLTPIGRGFVIVGSAPGAAHAAGFAVTGYRMATYAFAGGCFATAGLLLAGLIGSASHLAGPEYLLPGIAAVVVGGTAFTGGRGSLVASGVAAVFMEQLDQLVLSLGAGTAGQLLVQSLAIVVATSLRHLPLIAGALSRLRRG